MQHQIFDILQNDWEKGFIYAVECALQMTFLTIQISSDYVGWLSNGEYLDESSKQCDIFVHQTATCLHYLRAAMHSPQETPQSGDSLLSWCLVDPSSSAGLWFEQLHSIGGDYLRSNHSHQDTYSVTMCVVLCFALAGELVQIPDAAYSIPRTSVLLPHSSLW